MQSSVRPWALHFLISHECMLLLLGWSEDSGILRVNDKDTPMFVAPPPSPSIPCLLSLPTDLVFQHFFTTVQKSAGSPQSPESHELRVAKRHNHYPSLFIREAKVEDNDDLLPIFRNCSQNLDKQYGMSSWALVGWSSRLDSKGDWIGVCTYVCTVSVFSVLGLPYTCEWFIFSKCISFSSLSPPCTLPSKVTF